MSQSSSTRPAVILLSAQTLAFGIAMALLVVPATSLFLDAYGSEWLPVSYIAVAVVGTAISWMVARAVRRFQLVAVATARARCASTALQHVVGRIGSRWPVDLSSTARVVPAALQIGFVFVGGQAGRVLNVRELKELFPRIVSGFVIGFFIGGLAGLPLLALREEPQDLLVGAAVAQLAFVGLLIVTDRRIPAVRSEGRPDNAGTDEPPRPRVPLRTVLANRLIVVIFAYQVLSAIGSQLVDYLMFDRAAHRYPDAADLTRWVTWFTAVVNLVNFVVLVVFAGYLLKRFGIRFGLIANPAVVGLCLVALAVSGVNSGTVTVAFLTLSTATRITDIVLTDATTRTSINATYQLVPVDERLAVQTAIESGGVPAAIGLTGVILLVLQALPGGITVVVGVATVVAIAWTVVAWMANREYTEGLRQAVVKRILVESPLDLTDEREAESLRQLLRSDDGRQVALGLDLLAGLNSPARDAELKRLLDDDDPEVRLGALAGLARNDRLSTLATADAATVIAALDGDGDLTSPVSLRAIGACARYLPRSRLNAWLPTSSIQTVRPGRSSLRRWPALTPPSHRRSPKRWRAPSVLTPTTQRGSSPCAGLVPTLRDRSGARWTKNSICCVPGQCRCSASVTATSPAALRVPSSRMVTVGISGRSLSRPWR